MVKRLTDDTITANKYTIAPNLSGAIWITLACILSDYFQSRALIAVFAVGVSMIGFICLGTVDLVDKVGVGYFFTFLLTFGVSTYPNLPPYPCNGNVSNKNATGIHPSRPRPRVDIKQYNLQLGESNNIGTSNGVTEHRGYNLLVSVSG